MVYTKMTHIERPEGILVGKSIAVEMKDGRRSYTAYPHGTLAHTRSIPVQTQTTQSTYCATTARCTCSSSARSTAGAGTE